MKKNKKKNKEDNLYKISSKINGFTYFTILTEKTKKGENLTLSPNKEYAFNIGNKIDGDVLIPCALSIRLEDYAIVEARELPKRANNCISIKKDIEEFEKVVNEMIQKNSELYEYNDLEK